MISLKGSGLKIFAAILAVIALAFGAYSAFFRSEGFVDGTATIISIEEDPDPDNTGDVQYIVKAKYTVDGKEYTTTLNSYDPAYKVGGDVAIKYDPNNPEKMTSGFGIGIAVMIIGAALLAVVIFLTVKKKVSVKKLKETNGELTYAPSVKGEERELYFLTDVGTIKGGHHLEDKNRRVLYEAKMTKFSPLSAFAFDFIDHENNKTTKHLVGHAEEMDWNSILIDNNYTFTIDGQAVEARLGGAPRFTNVGDRVRIKYLPEKPRYQVPAREAEVRYYYQIIHITAYISAYRVKRDERITNSR